MAIVGKTATATDFRRSRWLLTAVLALYFVYTFIPILYVIAASTKTNPDLFGTFGLWFSNDFHLFENLRDLFTQDKGTFSRWLWNSFYYAFLSGVGAALVSTMAGYAFSKYDFAGKRFIYALVLGAVMIPQTALVIPLFLMLSQVKLLDTPWAVILPQLVFPQGVFLMRAYIDDAVSNEIIDAGRVDGAGEFRIFSTFRLPAHHAGRLDGVRAGVRRQLEQLLPAAGRAQFLRALPHHRGPCQLVRLGRRRQRRLAALHRCDDRLAGFDRPGDPCLPDDPALLAGRPIDGRGQDLSPSGNSAAR